MYLDDWDLDETEEAAVIEVLISMGDEQSIFLESNLTVFIPWPYENGE
jgi:hypothetical protein